MAKEFPKIFYGLHFYPGVAEYRPPDADPYRVFVSEDAIRRMGPTFAGKPVYVKHVGEVDLGNLQNEADGYVMESFFNKADGKHWTKFIVVSDAAQNAIRSGFKLSNAYVPKSYAPGGIHNGLEFDKEVVDGEYEHLALVDDPRYEESIILTPEEFKEYNSKKELELQRLSNSKQGDKKMALQFWKRAKIENSADFESTVVLLPISKKEMTITQLVNEMDKIQNMHGYANGDHMVKVGEEEMSVNDLVGKFGDATKKNAEDEEKKKENADDEKKEPDLANADEDKKEENSDDEEKKENEDDEDKKENADEDKKEEPKKNSSDKSKKDKKHFESIMNAADKADAEESTVDLPHNQLARGKVRYGSI